MPKKPMTNKARDRVARTSPDMARHTRSVLATSEAAREKYVQRRGMPLVLGKNVRPFGHTVMKYKELVELRIDERYQREEVSQKVNELIHVIREGGQIVDPISVVMRPDGSKYIVDGQQRWWAAVDCEVSLPVNLFKVDDYEAEVTLFNVLNNNAALGPTVRLRAWPGDAGKVLKRLNEDPKSPLYGRVNFKNVGTAVAFPAVPLLRGIVAVLTGTQAQGALQVLLQKFDMIYRGKPWADQAIQQYVTLISQVFEAKNERRMRPLAALAIGLTAHDRWKDQKVGDEWPMPTQPQIARLRNVRWGDLMPSASVKWLPVVENEIRTVWK